MRTLPLPLADDGKRKCALDGCHERFWPRGPKAFHDERCRRAAWNRKHVVVRYTTEEVAAVESALRTTLAARERAERRLAGA